MPTTTETMDVTQQIIDALFLPMAIFAGILLVMVLLVLRLTYQSAEVARRQRRMLALVEAIRPQGAPTVGRDPGPRPAEPGNANHQPPVLALPAVTRHVADAPQPARPAPEPEHAPEPEADDGIEPIKVRTDPEFGVIYSFRGKDYLSRVAADQARWRSINEPARPVRSSGG